jgi:Zn-dependent protease with chaperone function
MARLREYLAQNILHALVATGVVETLLRVWRLSDPADRLPFRLLALTLPLAVAPVFWAVAPFRTGPEFRDSLALFSSAHWTALRVGGVSLGGVLLWAAVAAGLLLFARDITPLMRGHHSHDDQGVELGADAPLVETMRELARLVGLATPPRVRWLEDAAPVLFATGVATPTLVVSRGALARLDDAELRATLTHELVHMTLGDVLFGWVVMAARTLMCFNPIAQVVARGVVLELERRADDTAAKVLQAPGALADGMERLVGARLRRDERPNPRSFDELVLGLASTGRAAALARRCGRLRGAWPPQRVPQPGLRVGLTGVALAGLLFFVV